MKLKIDQFCNLATSPSWQAWLYNLDKELSKEFMLKIQNSKGCSQNKDIMLNTLRKIQDHGLADRLMNYMVANYPNMVEDLSAMPSKFNGPVFNFNPNLVTFPRRIVFQGSINDIKRRINSFALDKIKYDSIIVDGVGYVEYLTKEDKSIESQIPAKNWLIAAYRLGVST